MNERNLLRLYDPTFPSFFQAALTLIDKRLRVVEVRIERWVREHRAGDLKSV